MVILNKINPEILKFIHDHNGIITTQQVTDLGFTRQLLMKYIQAGLLERVRQGVYTLPDHIHDDMFTMCMRSDHIVFSHESALYLNGLSDRTPFIHTITMPSNKSVPGSIKNECTCFYVRPDLHSIGVIDKRTVFGNPVRCYDAERTVCDFLRSRERCDEETFVSSIKNYAAFKNKNLNRLATYASAFKVEEDVRRYMEVLL